MDMMYSDENNNKVWVVHSPKIREIHTIHTEATKHKTMFCISLRKIIYVKTTENHFFSALTGISGVLLPLRGACVVALWLPGAFFKNVL